MKPLYDNPLPIGWNERPLAQVVQLRRGYTWTKEDETDRPEEGAVPVIRIPNIQDRLELSDLVYLRNISSEALEKAAVTKGWLLFIGSNGSQDRIGDSVLIEEDRAMVFASFLMGMTVKDQQELIPEFLASWMRLHLVHEWFSKTSQQTTGLGNYSWSAVKRLPLRFPDDPAEQRRIAAALALADDAIAKAKAELEATRELKRSLMQTLFVSGMPGRHSEFVETKIGPVPKGWQLKQLGDVLVSSQYGLSESMVESGRFPILRMNNIENGIVNADDVKYIDLDDATFEVFRLRAGDILFNRTNSMEYVGRVGILNEDMDAVFASYLVRLVADRSQVDPWFLNFCMNSTHVKNRYRRYATPAVQQANINPRNLKKTLIAFPSLEDSNEQHEIIELLRSVNDSIISLNKKIEALQQLKKSLLQNLLTGKIRIPEGALNV